MTTPNHRDLSPTERSALEEFRAAYQWDGRAIEFRGRPLTSESELVRIMRDSFTESDLGELRGVIAERTHENQEARDVLEAFEASQAAADVEEVRRLMSYRKTPEGQREATIELLTEIRDLLSGARR